MAERFSSQAANTLSANGIEVLLCDRDAPTPAISYAIRSKKALGGINFTASHNPPEYCGIKFSTPDGAPAMPEVTKTIEANVVRLQAGGQTLDRSVVTKAEVLAFDAKPGYLTDIESKVDIKLIAKSGLRIAYDALYAT